ncbi:MAG: 3-isopropylmalate dehydrogenase [Gammaproteobacteria bacterium]|nr:3-isopropylmalate dehydrogenase [Gammaproteobacteria bacterium]
MKPHRILLLPGDGIGPEVTTQARRLLETLAARGEIAFEFEEGLIGGAAVDARGKPLPEETLVAARRADAVLMGAVGGPKWDGAPRAAHPERGLLAIRSGLELYANLRPVRCADALADASSLKPELIRGVDVLIVRELTGGIYFGEPRGIFEEDGERVGINTERYRESEIARICRNALELARLRRGQVVSVDKANVLESSQLWREVAKTVARDYPDVRLTHLYVDNAAMQLVRSPKSFDVMVTSNLFGDILSDIGAQLTGSIGLLPSASLNADGRGLYEPVHGSAPDIAGRGLANPLAAILSAAMMLRHSLGRSDLAERVERAVERALARGIRTADIARPGQDVVSTVRMGQAVAEALY